MLEEKLAALVAQTVFSEMDERTVHVLKRNILDSYAGICLSLKDVDMLGKFDAMTSLTPTEKGLAVWGLHRKANTSNAVFMNTILGRRSDLVNTYLPPNGMGGCHPSDNVSLVLSMADWLKKSGKDVLSLMHVAYLLSCAFTDYYHPEENGYDHDTPALLYLSLTIGCAMGLSVPGLTEAQRIAGMLGLDIDQAAKGEVTDWKHCTYASCAMRALHAVKIAYAGFEGPRNIYEGEAGINRFLPHAGSIVDPPPDLESIVFKRWPALVFCQTPIDAAVEIAGRIDDPEAIDRVLIHTYKKAIEEADGDAAYRPVSRAGRTHSLPYCVAVALVKKTVEYESFNDGFLGKEEAVARLIPKIAVAEDVHMTRTYPDGSPCRIEVTLKSGETIRLSREFPRGDPHDPLTDREIEEKVEECMTHLASRDEVRTIIERIWELEREDSVDWLVAPLKQRILKTDGREDS